MSASNNYDLTSLDQIPMMDECGLESLWLNDDPSLLWDLDIPQTFEAELNPTPSRKSSQTSAVSVAASDTSDEPKRKSTEEGTGKVMKRREQNRASQRLFRERKINYVKGIELQLEDLNERYQDLTVSFNNQTKEKVAMLAQIAKLTAKLASKD